MSIACPSVSLSEVCSFRHGGTPSKSKAEFWGGEIPWISPKDMKLPLLTSSQDSITTYGVEGSAASVVPEGSILVVARSGILAHTLPVAKAGCPLAFNQDIKAIQITSDRVLSDFVYWFLRGKESEVLSRGVKKGATVHSLHSGYLERLAIPLLPIPEQRRIVDLLSRAENIVRMRKEAEAKAKEIIPALFLDMFGDPGSNPKGWEVLSLLDLVTFVSGGTPSKSKAEFWSGDLPWVSPKDMKVPEIYDAEDHVSDQVPIQTSLKLIPTGAVLVVVRGMILVHTAPVAIARVPLTINQDMKALLTKGAIDPDYLMWLLRISQRWLLTLVTTAAHGTRKIDTARLETLRIPVPPRSLQDSFVRRIESLLSITSTQVQAKEHAEHTFQSLLAREFQE
jgi:type I restriction enzyme, S subunit